MAVLVPGTKPLNKIIEIALQRGCELRSPSLSMVVEGDEFPIRYLYNPHGGGRVMLSQFEDDELVSEEIQRHWERRLGIVIVDRK